MPAQSQTVPSDRNDQRESPAPSSALGATKRVSHRRRRWIILIGLIVLAIALAVGVYYYWESRYYASTDDAYIEGHPVSVSARVAGNVVGVHVKDNQHVPPGEWLVEVDPCDYQIGVARAEAALQAAQANEQKAAADVEATRADWTKKEQDWHRNEELVKQGAVTTQTAEHSRADAAAAKANLDAAERGLAAVRAQTGVAKVAVDAAHLQLSYTQVHAPEAGYVTQKSVEVGAYVNVGQPLLVIVSDRMFVIANFKETQLTHMRPGQPATIRIDAYPGVSFRGHVDSIQAGTGPTFSLFPPENATGNFVKIVQRVPVKIVFDGPPDPNHRLLLGLSVQPKVRIRDAGEQ
ncbi:MAG: HlyD family secretion protein [Planctomycetes bacterium]|nr:HlyD family secretion protein [Planctomycetota bacterium]